VAADGNIKDSNKFIVDNFENISNSSVPTTKAVSAYLNTELNSISANINNISLTSVSNTDEINNYAAVYRFTDASGKITNINIPKDQFLNAGKYDAVNKQLVLTFNTSAEGSTDVAIPVNEFVQTYTAGNGLKLSDNEFSLVKDNLSDSKYLVINSESIGLDGITNDLAIISGNTLLSAQTYTDKQLSEAGVLTSA
jgi:hypothetical protein